MKKIIFLSIGILLLAYGVLMIFNVNIPDFGMELDAKGKEGVGLIFCLLSGTSFLLIPSKK